MTNKGIANSFPADLPLIEPKTFMIELFRLFSKPGSQVIAIMITAKKRITIADKN